MPSPRPDALLLPLLLACGVDEDLLPPTPCGPCVLQDANNFQYEAELEVASAPLEELADVLVDWSGLTQNFYGRPIDPAVDIAEAWLVVFTNLSPSEVVEDIAQDTLDQSDVSLYVTCAADDASCLLSEFNIFGNYLDVQQYFEDGQGAWLVSLVDSADQGFHSLLFLDATPGATATTARFTDESAVLSADVDLEGLTPVYMPPGADVELDWSGLTVDGLGNEAAVHKLDELLVARYDADLPALEQDFFFLRDVAAESWSLSVSERTSVNLTELGRDFTGISSDGVWLLGLFCGTCENPAPRFLTVLEPAG